ncbi:p-aminobenzoate N-oxygenase AurF [Chromobacterium violaceum]|nr:diiron oxygenase [Chromobacterium violaceum]ATP28180.1 hypothetical protein CRN81_07120 [Chromobacterium violaceum]ATP32089.1 hypothetical protein CR207_07145 [Chromobacterium violaceum]KJH68772.1 hypothetical protein UF16_03940 [Chromobacterium violaceum]MBP4050457.1 diiron oxygenase [Chromobacterium violaceum]MBT2867114.1 diiron oxygenase [Chromobacterium violaceum]
METSTVARDPLGLSDESRRKVQTLIRASHRKTMELESVLPWENGINLSLPPKMETGSWIYGTPYWDAMTPEQRHETLWKETARDVSMFIWLEQTLPPLYVGYINRFRFDLSPEVYEYLMIFSREEITHTLMFRRYMKMAGLELFQPPGGAYGSFVEKLPMMNPVIGILWTLMIEWAAELSAMYLTQSAEVEPLTKMMFHEHHIEEVRHIAFGKRIVEHFFDTAPEAELAAMRAQIGQLLRHFKAEMTFNSEIAKHTSFVFPIQPGDEEAIALVRGSANNQRLNSERFAELDQWFAELGIV